MSATTNDAPTTNNSAQHKTSTRNTRGGQRIRERFPWSGSPVVGYVASFLLVLVLLLIEKIDEHIPGVSIFVGAPFALLAILVALIWGTGPALVSLGLGLIIVLEFISPRAIATSLLQDFIVVGPFIALQIVAIATVVRLERSRKELQTSYQQLEQANAQKDYVLTRAAHELRTPLTTILGRTQLLSSRLKKSGETPESWAEVQKCLKTVEIRALRLRALIDSLFDLSRTRAQDVSSQFSSCDFEDLCREIIENQRTLAGRQIELDFPGHPIILQADEKRLAQVLTNLLVNAIQYSPEDTRIAVGVSSNNDFVTLHIHNESSPLSPEQVERLFEPFYRTPSVEYSSITGWGLGLTISKEIVEQHGGTIWVEATPKGGITFFVRLRLLQRAV